MDKSVDEILEPKESKKSNIPPIKEKPENQNLNLETVNNVLEDVDSEKPKSRGKSGGRKSKKQKEEEEKIAEMEKVADIVMKSSVALFVQQISFIVATITKDEKWRAEQEESQMIGEALIQSLDFHFPNWKVASPDLALIAAIIGYVAKRVIQKQDI